jgi:hypothetical protein
LGNALRECLENLLKASGKSSYWQAGDLPQCAQHGQNLVG